MDSAGGCWLNYRPMGLKTLHHKVMGAMAVSLRCLRFKALCGTATIMIGRVAYHQGKDLFIASLIIIKKRRRTLLKTIDNCRGKFRHLMRHGSFLSNIIGGHSLLGVNYD